jgi:hypothetical protein
MVSLLKYFRCSYRLIWTYTITPTCITRRKNGRNIFWNFSAEIKNIPTGKLYWYGLFGGAHLYFQPNDVTLQQMKSSGSLRFFEKTIAYDASNYDRLCRVLLTTQNEMSDIYAEVRKSRAMIFEYRYNDIANNIFQANKKSFDQEKIDSFFRTNPPLLSYDKVLFNEYVELVRSRFMRSNVIIADSLLSQSTRLIQELKDKYDLDDDKE